jgi:hypothetical protein
VFVRLLLRCSNLWLNGAALRHMPIQVIRDFFDIGLL